jgi:hypothetical protein
VIDAVEVISKTSFAIALSLVKNKLQVAAN